MKYVAAALLAFTLIAPGFQAQAADVPTKKTAQVQSGLYVTAKEAWDMMQKDEKVVLIDVRDPIEVMFTGFTDETDIHVPYLLSDRTKQNAKKSVYAMAKNPNFVKEVKEALLAKNVSKDTPLVFMCRSGSTRSAPAADLFFNEGWTKSYTMVDGFEGGKNKEGNSKGVRDVDGWRNSGLPWGYKLNFEKMYMAAE
ncbi:rhodanese-like domain-containing protein [Terasakiella sp.]|jgi:rhodanese-related sulfurtransferase|uniref:rhodanese-like domain-containing protein n=1 Tax=Terasakiella sp. TaxID=2034861 RepID=UPI003AA8D44E